MEIIEYLVAFPEHTIAGDQIGRAISDDRKGTNAKRIQACPFEAPARVRLPN